MSNDILLVEPLRLGCWRSCSPSNCPERLNFDNRPALKLHVTVLQILPPKQKQGRGVLMAFGENSGLALNYHVPQPLPVFIIVIG